MTTNQLPIHYGSKQCNTGKLFRHSYISIPEELICRFCKKDLNNNRSFLNHERLCKHNPNRQNTPFNSQEFQKNKTGAGNSNKYIKAMKLGLPKPEISELTRKKMSDSYKRNRRFSYASKESIEFIREIISSIPELNNYVCYSHSDKHEYVLNYDGKKFCYDFCIPELKIIVEYNGTKFHPRENDVHWISPFGVTYDEAFTKDKFKEKLANDNGFTVFYCWSDSKLDDIQIIINEIRSLL
jgi:histone H3/H4